MAKSDFSSLFDAETSSASDFSSLFSQESIPDEMPTAEQRPSFGQALAFQMKSGGPAGAPSLSPQQAKRVATEVGAQQAVAGAFTPLKYLASLSPYAPRALSFLTGLVESGATGAAVPAAHALAEGEELPSPKEMLEEGAIWAGIDLALQVAHLGTSFGLTVNKLSKETGLPKREVVSRVWQGAKNYYGWKEPKIDPETGAKIIPPEQIEAMSRFAEREVETLQGEVVPEKISEPELPIAKKDALTELFEKTATGPEIASPKPIKGEHFEINPRFTSFGFSPQEEPSYLKFAESGQEFLSEIKKKFYQKIPKNSIRQLKSEWGFFMPPQYFDKFYTSLPGKLPDARKMTVNQMENFLDPVFLGTLNDLIKDENVREFLKPILYKKVYKMAVREELYRRNTGGFYRPTDGSIHISSGYSPASVYSSLMHESFHALQDQYNMLHQPNRRTFFGRRKMSKGEREEYIDSAIEMEARAFERIVSNKINNYRKALEKSGKISRRQKIRELSAAAEPRIQKMLIPGRVSKNEPPQLTAKQIQARKIAAAEVKKIQERQIQEFRERKERAEKERTVAFRAMGIGAAKEASSEVKTAVIPDNPDGTELEQALEETLSPNDTLRAQAMAEAQHMKDKIVGKLDGIWAKFDVEAPFKAVGASKTGKAVKLFYDTKNAFLEEAKGLIKKFQALGLSKDQLWDAFLAAESNTKLSTEEMNQARDMFRNYFDKSFSKLKEEGVLSLPWPQSAISRLEQTIVDLKTKLTLPNILKQAEGRIGKEIEEIRKTIALLRKLKYIPKSASLITKALAEVLPDMQPKTLRRFAIAAHKKRTTGALADWVASQPEIREALHPYDFLGFYANRKGNDIALLRIAKNAIEEGLASKGEKLGFKMQPGEFPALEGYSLHPALYEYLKNLTNPLPFNAYDKISRWAKSAIVFDPTYLGTLIPYFRTLFQNPKQLARLPKYWKKALHDMLNKTPAYIEFLENGGASNPYPEAKDFESWLEVEKLKNGSPEQMLFSHFLTKEGATNLFNQIANFSWMTDRLARLAYYNLLLDKGFSVSDAAKLSAENFVDYNKLPAKTRRWLGRIFFAPATQVLSIINDVVLAASPLRLTHKFFRDKEGFKNDNVNTERVRLLVGTVMVIAAISQLMRSWGFREEEIGTRYVANYEDENGKPKEAVISMTHALNYSLRWVNTFWRGFGPGESAPSQKLWGRLVGQIGPVPNMIMELGQNKDRDGKKIWDPIGDDYPSAFMKISKYIFRHLEPFGLEKFHTTDSRKRARDAIREHMGWAEWFMDSIEFFYSRKPEKQRVMSRIRYLKAEMRKLSKTGELTEDARKRYEKSIEDLALRIND